MERGFPAEPIGANFKINISFSVECTQFFLRTLFSFLGMSQDPRYPLIVFKFLTLLSFRLPFSSSQHKTPLNVFS